MANRSSRPAPQPQPGPDPHERRIIKVRVLPPWGPARIGFLLGIATSSVYRVLDRYGLAWLATSTAPAVNRFWAPAAAWFRAQGIDTIARVLTDNGSSCYRSREAHALRDTDTYTRVPDLMRRNS